MISMNIIEWYMPLSELHFTDTDINRYGHIGTNTDSNIGIGASLVMGLGFDNTQK